MKLITLTCPKCGAQMEVNPELEAIICNYLIVTGENGDGEKGKLIYCA